MIKELEIQAMKVLFVPFAPSLAHVSRCLAVAEAWRDRGHTAIFATGPECAALVEGAGFETHSLPEVSGQVFRTDRGFGWLTVEYFEQNLRAEQAILSNVEPDAVVFDFRFTTALAARLAGRPAVSIVHGNAFRLAMEPRETAKLLLGGPGDQRGPTALRQRFVQRLFPFIFQRFQRAVARRLAPILKAHDQPEVDSPFELLLGDGCLVADIPALLPANLPANCHVVGPLMWAGWEQPAPWLDELDDRPLIYVTMGSTVEAQSALVKIVDALRSAPYNVVVTVGSLVPVFDLDLPAHIRVFPTVPGATVVKRSSAVLHHGGHETLMQVLAAGVPSLIVPTNPDQILIAHQAQALGIGHSLWQPGELPVGTRTLEEKSVDEIRQAIDDLLADQACYQTCQTFKQEMERFDGARTAAKILEKSPYWGLDKQPKV